MPTASNPVAHTPGPWELIALSDRLYVQSKGQSLIADVGGTKIMDLIPTPLANARLIAAAPEMLEALEKWVCPACGGTRVYSGYSADAPNGQPCRKCAQTDGLHPIAWAAIQKARG